jgi:farnesyl diphosphate synthase
VCADLKADMLEILARDHQLPQEALDWVAASIEYNCLGGKLNRGISVVHWFVLLPSSCVVAVGQLV